MSELAKLFAKHKGKAAGGTLALVFYLFARGCDLTFHIDPLKIHARTNATPAAVTTNTP